MQRKAKEVQPIRSEFFKDTNSLEVTWLGGGGAAINDHGTILMIDPVFEGFDMPLLCNPPIASKDVHRVDGVLITHCDNDHMSKETLLNLKDKVKEIHAPHYVAGLINEMGLKAIGHDIGESFEIGNTKITLTPADHAWQNESPKHHTRDFKLEDFCGYLIQAQDKEIWMPGDSRLMKEQLELKEPDLILMDISDSRWHIGKEGVKTLCKTYPHALLIPIHFGCVDAENWKEFNGDPDEIKEMIKNPERFMELAPGQIYTFE